MGTALSTFNFHGDSIECIPDGAALWVGVTTICNGVGIDDRTQREKLSAKSWAITQMVKTTTADGREREVFCIDLDSLPMWLATIDERRVPVDVRPKLVRYQRECKKALADFFFGRERDPGEGISAQIRTTIRQELRSIVREEMSIAAEEQQARHMQLGDALSEAFGRGEYMASERDADILHEIRHLPRTEEIERVVRTVEEERAQRERPAEPRSFKPQDMMRIFAEMFARAAGLTVGVPQARRTEEPPMGVVNTAGAAAILEILPNTLRKRLERGDEALRACIVARRGMRDLFDVAKLQEYARRMEQA